MRDAAVWHFFQSLDHRLFFFINNGCAHRWLDPVFVGLSVMGEWTIGIVALAMLAGEGRKRLWRHALVVAAFLVFASAYNSMLKEIVRRPRPLKVFSAEIAAGRVRVNVLERQGLKRQSLPSGHSMLAFFLMTYVGQCRRNLRPWALALATGIAISRVYVGSHFPFDCLVGAAIGFVWGLLAWLAHEKLERSVWKTS